MLIETVEQRIRLVKPRSFAGLMTLYEGNHAKMRQLLGNLRYLPSQLMSKSATDLSIHLSLHGRSKYTSTLCMTYWFDDDVKSSDPELVVRIYHDARLAEAVSCREHPRHPVFNGGCSPGAKPMEKRWLLNMLLCKWLEYCIDHRHVFV
ncbi:MAG: DUF1249 domain-containing protein [Gammaproteobacteria bacterium]|nr:DUF1249 domain-containing protein [Gammaproteobacteria bacterium]MDE2345262.1 DUF1249 domain-containing protein [Gammaproteobacteria bacterium]